MTQVDANKLEIIQDFGIGRRYQVFDRGSMEQVVASVEMQLFILRLGVCGPGGEVLGSSRQITKRDASIKGKEIILDAA